MFEQKANQLIEQGTKLTFKETITTHVYRGQYFSEEKELYQNWRNKVKNFIKKDLKNELVRLEKIEESYLNKRNVEEADIDEAKRLILKLLKDVLEKIEIPVDSNKSDLNEEKPSEKHSSDLDETALDSEDLDSEDLDETASLDKTTSQSHKQLLVFYDKENVELTSMITEMLALLNLESILLGQEEIINANRKERLEKIEGYDGAILCIQAPIEKKTEHLIISICSKYVENILLLWNTELENAEFEKIQDCFDDVKDQEMEQWVEFNKDSINFKNNVNFIKALKKFSQSNE